jgi:HD-like signal output (HDOD) protein
MTAPTEAINSPDRPTATKLGWLGSVRRLLGGASRPRPPAADLHAAAPPTPAADQAGAGGAGEAAPASPDMVELDRRFSALLLGAGELQATPMQAAERDVIEAIEGLLRDSGDAALLPRLPSVLPRLISLVRRDDCSSRELTDSLGRDPTLVGEVIRIANSPRYRTQREITNLQDAVVLLGQRGLVQLLIQATMRPIFEIDGGRLEQAHCSLPWRLTERCAHACSHLANDGSGIDPFNAYLAGMVVNLGWIPALRLFGTAYLPPRAPVTLAFHDALARSAARLSGSIARQWRFHQSVCEAVDRAALGLCPGGANVQVDRLAEALRTAVRMGKWQLLAPAWSEATLEGLTDPERRCCRELQRAFGG